MLETLHKFGALTLAFLVLFSTLSISVEEHICMGEIASVSFFSKADSCGMIENTCVTDDFSGTKMEKKKCCENVQEIIQGNQTEQQAQKNFEIEQVEFALAYIYTYSNLFEEKKKLTTFNDYVPPLVSKDLYVLNQTFLI